jgi:hypothetical protein
MLISCFFTRLYAQEPQKDTLKNVTTIDTLPPDDETIESTIIYNATDSIRYESEGNKVLMFGDAYVEYGSMTLKAEGIKIDYEKNLVTAFGKKDSSGKYLGAPLFKDGEQEMEADTIKYNLKTKRGKIYNALTKQGELLVRGAEIKKDSTNVIYMKNMACIPCDQKDARTIFRATKAKIIPNDKIVTGPMYLEIGGVPTPLGLPFGFFPNTRKRHNGILLPFFGNSPGRGYNLRDGGFYWGINEKTDMTIRGDIYSNGSWGVRTQNNYLLLYKFSGSLNLGYSEFNIGDKDIPAQFRKEKSYTVNWQHTQDNKNNPSVRFTANVNYINQKYNVYNAINSNQYLTNTFQSNINYSKIFSWSALNLNATHSQNTITKQTSISFPQLTFNVNRFFPFKRENAVKQNVFDKIGMNYLFEIQNTYSTFDSLLFKGDIEKNMRYGARHSLPISTNFNLFKYITVSPALNLSSVMYTKSTSKTLKNYADIIPVKSDTLSGFITGYDANFSTSLNTKIFSDFLFKTKRLKQIRYLLIPTVTYNYRPDFGEEQYGFWKKVRNDSLNRYGYYSVFENSLFGGPQRGEQNAISINLNNNIEAKVKKMNDTSFTFSKVTLLQNLGASASYNFAADSFKMSNINLSARNRIWKFFEIVASANYDPYKYDVTNKRRVNTFVYNESQTPLRFLQGNIALNGSFGSNALAAMQKVKQAPNMTNGAERGTVKANSLQAQERISWNLNMYYNVTIDKTIDPLKYTTLQTLNISGDISPTKYWRLGVTSGYDFTRKNVSYTSFNIYRDLKCWEARIDWVPFGFNKSYNLTINIKSGMLSDFKIPRQRQWYDNQN